MSTKHRVRVYLVARQMVTVEVDVEDADHDDVTDLTSEEQQRAIDSADPFAWGERQIEDVIEVRS